MNRTFMAPLTPARARLLTLMAKHNEFELDEAVYAKAEEDRVSADRFAGVDLTDPVEQAACQFILDTNWRAGIPVSSRERERATRVIKAAMRLAHIEDDDVVYIDSGVSRFVKDEHYIVDFDYESLLPLRKKVLMLNLDHLDQHSLSLDLIGKMFPRIVIAGCMQVQYSFSFGATNATTSQMGKILHPQIEEGIKRTMWKSNQRRSVLAMGVFPDLVPDADEQPKKISGNFVVPRTIEY